MQIGKLLHRWLIKCIYVRNYPTHAWNLSNCTHNLDVRLHMHFGHITDWKNCFSVLWWNNWCGAHDQKYDGASDRNSKSLWGLYSEAGIYHLCHYYFPIPIYPQWTNIWIEKRHFCKRRNTGREGSRDGVIKRKPEVWSLLLPVQCAFWKEVSWSSTLFLFQAELVI